MMREFTRLRWVKGRYGGRGTPTFLFVAPRPPTIQETPMGQTLQDAIFDAIRKWAIEHRRGILTRLRPPPTDANTVQWDLDDAEDAVRVSFKRVTEL